MFFKWMQQVTSHVLRLGGKCGYRRQDFCFCYMLNKKIFRPNRLIGGTKRGLGYRCFYASAARTSPSNEGFPTPMEKQTKTIGHSGLNLMSERFP